MGTCLCCGETGGEPATALRERVVLDHLAAAWNAFVELNGNDPGHPDDPIEFKDGIHRCQMIIAHRVAVRVDPETWKGERDLRDDFEPPPLQVGDVVRHVDRDADWTIKKIVVTRPDRPPSALCVDVDGREGWHSVDKLARVPR
jgi:hypothetical protein